MDKLLVYKNKKQEEYKLIHNQYGKKVYSNNNEKFSFVDGRLVEISIDDTRYKIESDYYCSELNESYVHNKQTNSVRIIKGKTRRITKNLFIYRYNHTYECKFLYGNYDGSFYEFKHDEVMIWRNKNRFYIRMKGMTFKLNKSNQRKIKNKIYKYNPDENSIRIINLNKLRVFDQDGLSFIYKLVKGTDRYENEANSITINHGQVVRVKDTSASLPVINNFCPLNGCHYDYNSELNQVVIKKIATPEKQNEYEEYILLDNRMSREEYYVNGKLVRIRFY